MTVGLAGADLVPAGLELLPDGRSRLQLDGRAITLPLLGIHQAGNALFAWAVAREAGLDLDAVARALESVRLPGGRGEVLRVGGLTVVNDCYNANPASFRAAIDLAGRMREDHRLVFVAGTMLELGAAHDAMHREIAEALVALSPDLLAAVGEFVPALAPWARELGDRLLCAPDAPALAGLLAPRLAAGDLVVLKASRGVALERIIPAIQGRFA